MLARLPSMAALLRARTGCAPATRLYASFKRRDAPPKPKSKTNAAAPLPKPRNEPTSQDFKTIVQIRTKSTQNEPLLQQPQPVRKSSTDGRSNDGSSSKGTNTTFRNIFIGVLVAATSLGGAYYYGIFDEDSTKKKQVDISKVKWASRPLKRNPESKGDFPTKVPYILIGGGTASFAAFRAIKSKDPTAKVLVISAEDSIPYMRPPLSKEIWQRKELPKVEELSFKQWNGQERSLYYEPPEFYLDIHELNTAPNGGVVIATGWEAKKLSTVLNVVILEDPKTGEEFPIQYDKCLIATGSTPKNLAIFEQAPLSVQQRTVLYRNIRDLENLWNKIQNAKSVAIIGGGFLGSELACSLGRRFKESTRAKVYQLFKEPGNMGRVLPEYLSKWTTNKVHEEGVTVIPDVEVQNAKITNNQVSLELSSGESVNAEIVIVAVGAKPCTELAELSSLEIDPNIGGFLVNAELGARTNLYVAGDAACFYDPVLGRRRVEHHDHAVVSGRLAGENMAGAAKPYKHQSMFWSDLGPDIGYEAIGIVDADLPTVAVFSKSEKAKENHKINESPEDEMSSNIDHTVIENLKIETTETRESSIKNDNSSHDYNKGVLFYLRNDIVVGMVLWNVFNKMHIARQVIAERRKYEDLNEVAKLFSLHEN